MSAPNFKWYNKDDKKRLLDKIEDRIWKWLGAKRLVIFTEDPTGKYKNDLHDKSVELWNLLGRLMDEDS